MRAQELLTALSIKVFTTEYEGIYYSKDKQIIPFTTIDVDGTGNLVLYHESRKPPLLIKDLLTKLMLNKKRQITYWDGEEKLPLFGYKIDDNKIIV